MTQRLHAIMLYLFIIWLPNLMRAMHIYLTSLNGVCVCVLCVLNTLYVVYPTSLNCLFWVHVKLALLKFQVAPCYAEISSKRLCLSCCETPTSSTRALLARSIWDISLSHCAPTTPSISTRALLFQNYNTHENSHLLWNPDTRNARGTPEPKEPPQIGGG